MQGKGSLLLKNTASLACSRTDKEASRLPHLHLGSEGLVKIQMCHLGKRDTVLLVFHDAHFTHILMFLNRDAFLQSL